MNEQPRNLSTLQRWMQAVITHPLGIAAGIESDEAREVIDIESEAVEEVVTRSAARTSIERLEVYGNAYFSRLLECLQDQFPALMQALTPEVFDQFALDYLQACPPHSYTLNNLSDRFADFLSETRPERENEDEPDWADFVIDLARMEEAIDTVFDGPGLERETPLTAEAIQAIPAERWPDSRLIPSPALHLLAFQFPINDYFTAYRQGEEPEMPDPEQTFLALHRREYIVRRFALTAPQHALLTVLVAGGTVNEAIAAAAELADDWEQLAQDLRTWFFDWCAAGFFRGVEVG